MVNIIPKLYLLSVETLLYACGSMGLCVDLSCLLTCRLLALDAQLSECVCVVHRLATCASVTMRSGPLSQQEKPIQHTFSLVLTNRRDCH